jgi:hypothetical protein
MLPVSLSWVSVSLHTPSGHSAHRKKSIPATRKVQQISCTSTLRSPRLSPSRASGLSDHKSELTLERYENMFPKVGHFCTHPGECSQVTKKHSEVTFFFAYPLWIPILLSVPMYIFSHNRVASCSQKHGSADRLLIRSGSSSESRGKSLDNVLN